MNEKLSTGGGPGRPSKVASLLEAYDCSALGAELEAMWTAEQNRRTLRDLAAYFNTQLLRAAVERADEQLLDGEAENLYRLLTDDAVSSADRTRARRRLERIGVDVNELEEQFVSYQAIRTYLTNERGAEYTPDTDDDPVAREAENLRKVQGRTTAVVEGKLDQLRASGHLDLQEFRTIVDVRVICEECNTQYSVGELLDVGGCDCDAERES